jgi:hypothetical protein
MKLYLSRILAAIICCAIGTGIFLALQHRALTKRNAEVLRSENAYEQGKREAEIDLSEGTLKLRVYGDATKSSGADLHAEEVFEKYGIELVRVAASIETDTSADRTLGYNQTSLTAIERRYGKGILDTIQQRAVVNPRKPAKKTDQ